jgi:hypothetical protein
MISLHRSSPATTPPTPANQKCERMSRTSDDPSLNESPDVQSFAATNWGISANRRARCNLSAKLGKFCHYHALSLFRTSKFHVELLITINIHHHLSHCHKRQSSQISSQAPDAVYPERILSIPDGFCSFRTDAGHPRRFR